MSASSKKRVYDLAKSYGMSGQELASKLRDLGFTQVKSHMTALSEFEVLEIQARLEAYGIVGESSGQSVTTVGGLKIKRKKKKAPPAEEPPAPPAAEEPPAEPEPEPEPTPEPEPEPAAEEPQPAAKAAEPEIAEPAEAEKEPEPEAEPEPESEAPVETAAEPEAETKAEAETEAPAEPASEPQAETAEKAEVSAEAEAKPAKAKKKKEKKDKKKTEEEDIVRPSAKRRSGKVVGFIDPSQFATKARPRPQSRRHSGSDDVVPDVMPTLGRDRRSGMVRGDTTRGALTAQELREREQGRFLRRRRPQQQGPGGRRGGGGPSQRSAPAGSPHSGSTVDIEMPITLKKLANTLAVKENQVLRVALRQVGFGININSIIDQETAELLAGEFEVELNVVEEVAAEEQLLSELEEKRQQVGEEELIQRAPTVAFLGHVDHGKTTLIDTIRKTQITEGEAGGITQHIGAYQVTTQQGHTLTIVDTPGHAAFTAMRARGAQAVDIVVLVVAADDGVKPQTEEALNHAKAAGTQIVVAINKMDKPEANPDRVRNELAALELTPEEWGGEIAMLEVSALKGDGLEDLLERVFLETEVLELKSHPSGPASGVVLEAELQQGKGKIAHLLVQDGNLKKGDVILAGEGYGKVRSIHDDRGKDLKEAGPSMPVEVTGLNELPTIGDRFYVVESLDQAQEVAEERARGIRQMELLERRRVVHESILEAVAESEKTTIPLIVKADTQGSVEVLKQQVGDLQHDEMDVKLIHAGVGGVLESDVDLAVTSGARILAFHTSANSKVRQAADRGGVDIKVYEVIYELLDDVRRLMEGELAPEIKEEVIGHAEVRRVFKSSKFGNIAGCYVLDGSITRSAKARLQRDDQVVWTGAIGSVRREKDDAKEVKEGFECGILLKDYNDIKEGDIIEAFKIVEIKRTL